MFRRILASVSNKQGLVDFLKPFVEQGATVVSSGGTAELLSKAEIKVTEVSQYTGFPECLGGRVKTLHPKVHMGLLYRADNEQDVDTLNQYEVQPFDLVIVNLYPYAEARTQGLDDKELVEFIDIGGPAMLRASAKNYENVCVVCDPADYRWVAEKNGELSLDDRRYLAAKVFQMTSQYDQMIAKDLYTSLESLNEQSKPLMLHGSLVASLRYGENPHQKAWWYSLENQGLHQAKVLQGKALSFNNILDLQAACTAVRSFALPTAVAVKHNNSCGVASNESHLVALQKALSADPVSVFGGIVATNFALTQEHALAMKDIFLECVLAPEITEEAMVELGKRKNLRVLVWPELMSSASALDFRSVDGGVLVQQADSLLAHSGEWKFLGEQPTSAELQDLEFAWQVCATLKSNAISVCAHSQSIGLGMGQVNRIDAVKQALQRAKEFHGETQGWVLASDAFFPFPDSIDIAAQYGVRWIVQPGGSIKDDEVIAAAKKHNINMVFTGKRHFRH